MNEKKLAAILAATQLYLEHEAASAQPAAAVPTRPPPEPGHWAQAGRQELMSGRRMIELRAFARAR